MTYTPFIASAKIPFATTTRTTTTKISITIDFPVEKRALHIQSTSPTITPSPDLSFVPRCYGLSIPSKICALNKTEVIPQHIIWCPLPKVCGLCPTHMNPGVNLLYQSIMLLSSALIRYGLISSAMFLFHASSICLIQNNKSSKSTYLFLYLREENISPKKLRDICLLRLKGGSL